MESPRLALPPPGIMRPNLPASVVGRPPAPPVIDWYKVPFPIMATEWLRGAANFPPFGSDVTKENMATHRIIGDRFEGKSALLKAIGIRQFQNGSTVYDLFGANDNEMLDVCDSPFWKDVVFIHSDRVKLDQRGPKKFETVKLSQLNPRTVPSQKWYVTTRAFFPRTDDDFYYYSALYRITKRMRNRGSFNRVDCILIREADEFISSAKQAGNARSQTDADEEFAKFHNQMLHYGYAVVLDQHRDVDVVKKVRSLTTNTFFKNLGGDIEIPRPIWYMLRYVDPERLLRSLAPHQFAIKTTGGSIGVGVFMLAPWHIKRGSGILERLDIHPTDVDTGREIPQDMEPVEEEPIDEGGQGKPLLAPRPSASGMRPSEPRRRGRPKIGLTSKQEQVVLNYVKDSMDTGKPTNINDLYSKLVAQEWRGSASSVRNLVAKAKGVLSAQNNQPS